METKNIRREKSALGKKVLSIKDDDAVTESERKMFQRQDQTDSVIEEELTERSQQQNENKYYFVMLEIKNQYNGSTFGFLRCVVEIYVSNDARLLKPTVFSLKKEAIDSKQFSKD